MTTRSWLPVTGYEYAVIPLEDGWGVVEYTNIYGGGKEWHIYHCERRCRSFGCMECGLVIPVEVIGFLEMCRWKR